MSNGSQNPGPDDVHPIHIEVDQAGNFTYHPATKIMAREQPHQEPRTAPFKVKWMAADNVTIYNVQFSSTPFQKASFKTGGGAQVAVVQPGVALGTYKYSVAVAAYGSVFQDNCPEICVEC